MKSFLFLIIFLASVHAHAFTILIDPGHGGEDDGAKANHTFNGVQTLIKEKDLALSIGLKLYELLSKKYSVFLTRSMDRTVSLPERAQIAEKVKADLFISIHINSSPDSRSFGFETYYLDNGNDVAVKKVERTENIQSKDEGVVQQILIDLAVEQTVKTSKPLAVYVHSSIKKRVGQKYKIPSRGIKPGLFYVLALSKRPGLLLEAGFITTPKERERMLSNAFQEAYANAVYLGIVEFIKSNQSLKK